MDLWGILCQMRITVQNQHFACRKEHRDGTALNDPPPQMISKISYPLTNEGCVNLSNVQRIVLSRSVGSFGNREHCDGKASATGKVGSVLRGHGFNIHSQ